VSRPGDLLEWANVTVNYPAGSDDWSGQPTKVEPPTDVILPEDPRPAEYDNWLYWKAGDSLRKLNDAYGVMPALNFENWTKAAYNTAFVGSAVSQFDFAHYSTTFRCWCVSSYDTSGSGLTSLLFTQDFKHVVTPYTGSALTYVQRTAAAFDLGGTFYLMAEGAISPAANLHYSNGGAWTSIDVTQLRDRNNAIVVVFGSYVCVYSDSLGVPGSNGLSYTTTPTNTTWSFRAPLTTAQLLCGAASSTRLATFNRNWANASNVNYETTDDMSTFTARTLSTSVLAATEQIKGVTYSDQNDEFYLLIQTAAGGFKIAASPDAVNWTVRATVSSAPGTPISIKALGSLLVVTLTPPSAGYGANAGNLLFSVDEGTTWYQGNSQLYSVSSPVRPPRVFTGGGRVVHMNDDTLRPSVVIGLPPAVT
jgi:hypothetical protein